MRHERARRVQEDAKDSCAWIKWCSEVAIMRRVRWSAEIVDDGFSFPSVSFPFLGAGFGAPKFRSSEVLVTKREERDGWAKWWDDFHSLEWREWTDESLPRSIVGYIETKLWWYWGLGDEVEGLIKWLLLFFGFRWPTSLRICHSWLRYVIDLVNWTLICER